MGSEEPGVHSGPAAPLQPVSSAHEDPPSSSARRSWERPRQEPKSGPRHWCMVASTAAFQSQPKKVLSLVLTLDHGF